jgi:tRNA threonylcarbamoyladenosine biosynthesis protein TsaE
MRKVQLSNLHEFARNVLARLDVKNTATIVALRGDLGSGKTTFVQALGKALGIGDTIQSPTYVLMKKYEIKKALPFKTLVHIDAYRLEKPEEFAALKPEQFLNDPKNLVVVEWPKRLGSALPPADLTVNFSSQDAEEWERYIEIV